MSLEIIIIGVITALTATISACFMGLKESIIEDIDLCFGMCSIHRDIDHKD